jgi:hypothetical protein
MSRGTHIYPHLAYRNPYFTVLPRCCVDAVVDTKLTESSASVSSVLVYRLKVLAAL